LAAPVFIYEDIWTDFYEYGGALQHILLLTAGVSYVCFKKVQHSRAKILLLFTWLYSLYAHLSDIIFGGSNFEFYIIQTLFALVGVAWIICREYEIE